MPRPTGRRRRSTGGARQWYRNLMGERERLLAAAAEVDSLERCRVAHGKFAYPSEQAATKAAVLLRQATGKINRAYRCQGPDDHWHLTSQP